MNLPVPVRRLHERLLTLAADPATAQRPALIVDGVTHAYAELAESAQRLAAHLVRNGVQRGDRIAIYMDNSWPCVVSIYAALLAGGVFLLVNPQTRSAKLDFILGDSDAAALLSDGHLAQEFVPLLERHPALVVVASGQLPEHVGVTAWDAALSGNPPLHETVFGIPLDLAALIYTSGSTGQPKGVMQTHQSMTFTVGSLVEYLRLGADDRILCALPLAFDYGLYQLLMSVHLGATLVLERSFTWTAQVIARMREFGVTVFPGVPTMFAMLLSTHHREPLELPAVTRVTNTAAALPDSTVTTLHEIFPNALVYKMYGLTECKRVCYLEPELADSKPGSVGKAIPGTEVFLRSPEGDPVPVGEAGILYVRGPHVMQGYWKRPEQTAHMLKAGWLPGEHVLCTHDWFRMDHEGFLYFVGRSDDIIKSRGEKVSPAEVENVIHAMEGVSEVAVIGVPDVVLGQAIHAYVVMEPGAVVSAAEVRAHCSRLLENYMVPQQVVLRDTLPQTATGKISKAALLQQATGTAPA